MLIHVYVLVEFCNTFSILPLLRPEVHVIFRYCAIFICKHFFFSNTNLSALSPDTEQHQEITITFLNLFNIAPLFYILFILKFSIISWMWQKLGEISELKQQWSKHQRPSGPCGISCTTKTMVHRIYNSHYWC